MAGAILKTAVSFIQIKTLCGLALAVVFLAESVAWAADLNPYSLRSTWYIEDEEQPFWEVRVTCNDHQTFRYMRRYDESAPWCASEVPDLCSDRKLDVAFDMCDESYAGRLAEYQEREARKARELAQRERLETELMQQANVLQQRRRELDNRKAELERKEQELRARERALSEQKAKLRLESR